MRLGYNTNGFAHHRLVDAIHILGELGYESVALTLDYHALNPFEDGLGRRIEAVRNALDRHSMSCVIETGARFLLDPWRKHQPTLLSEPGEARLRLDLLKRSIDIAVSLKADAVSFWSGASDAEESVQWERLIRGCRELCAYAEGSNVRLAFEPEPGMLIDTMPRFERLYEAVSHPLFGLTLDLGHLHCQGELPIEKHIREWRDRLWNVHLEDMRRGVHDHLRFGEGEMEFPPIFRALREIDYQGGIHIELSRHSHQAVEVARESLDFCHALLR